MTVSKFILVLFVFLLAGPLLGWFTVDPKLSGIVGIAFVVAAIVEAVLVSTGRNVVVLGRKHATVE